MRKLSKTSNFFFPIIFQICITIMLENSRCFSFFPGYYHCRQSLDNGSNGVPSLALRIVGLALRLSPWCQDKCTYSPVILHICQDKCTCSTVILQICRYKCTCSTVILHICRDKCTCSTVTLHI